MTPVAPVTNTRAMSQRRAMRASDVGGADRAPVESPDQAMPDQAWRRRQHHHPLIQVGAGEHHVRAQHRQGERDELQRRLPPSQRRRRHVDPACLDGRPQAEDRELAGDDHERHPRRGAVHGHERDQRGRHQQLVGGRVQKRAELGGHPPAAGQAAVEPVGGRRHQEDAGGDRVGAARTSAMIGAAATIRNPVPTASARDDRQAGSEPTSTAEEVTSRLPRRIRRRRRLRGHGQ